MKLTTGILVLMVMAGSAGAQNPNIIQNTRDNLNSVQQKKEADSNAALDASSGQAKPTPAKTVATAGRPVPSKPMATAKPATPSAPHVSTTSTATTSASVAPKVTAQPTSITTTPKSNATPVQKPAATTMSKPSGAPASAGGKGAAVAKPAPAPQTEEKTGARKSVVVIVPKPAKTAKTAKTAQAKPVVQAQRPVGDKPPQDKEKKYAMTGKRDPFVSPVVNHVGGSGCNTGKKCLEIAQISLKGVVRSDTGMIAVVTNSMNKAYFLRENDPVFNGYVEKITVDSITFKETFQDKLGKSFSRNVVKKIVTPAV